MIPTPEQRERRNARKKERKLKRKQRRKARIGRSLVRAGYLRRCGKCGEVGHYAPTCRAP